MKARNILLAVVAIGIAASAAVALVGRNSASPASIVHNRAPGVAYAQDGGGGTPPPPPGGGGAPPGGGGAPPPPGGAPPAAGGAKPATDTGASAAANMTDAQKLKKLEDWKNQDPRKIIEKKYTDLTTKETHPDDENNPEQFIPETGRVDPLTIVSGAIPDELKPPRSGETDINEFQSYLYSEMASEAVDELAKNVDVYNVIQIGLEKIVAVRVFGERHNLSQGGGFDFYFGGKDQFPIQMSFALASASTDEVVISITAQPYGSNVSITKNIPFIPVGGN